MPLRLCRSMLILAVIASPTLATAHDLWLIPPNQASSGKPVHIHAHVGSDFPVSEHAIDPLKFKRRVVVEPDGKEQELKAAGQEEKAALLEFTPIKPGLHIVAVETQPRLITLEAPAFNNYLIADGMPHIYRLRHQNKTLDQPGRERYSKHVKALVSVGKGPGDATRPIGMTLELVPLRDPFALKVGDALPVRVLFQGKPLPEANLGWQHPGDGEMARGYVRTDVKGEALVPLARPGLMTIRLTHMTRPKAAEYEWESFWSTLTFRLTE